MMKTKYIIYEVDDKVIECMYSAFYKPWWSCKWRPVKTCITIGTIKDCQKYIASHKRNGNTPPKLTIKTTKVLNR